MINVDLSFLVTVLYVIILYIFLSRFFFGPLNRVLKMRHGLIEGRLEEARKRMEQVELRTSEYEQALKVARSEAYQRQEEVRGDALMRKADLISEAKRQADQTVAAGRAQLAAQGETIRTKLEAEVDTLAKKLTTSILRD